MYLLKLQALLSFSIYFSGLQLYRYPYANAVLYGPLPAKTIYLSKIPQPPQNANFPFPPHNPRRCISKLPHRRGTNPCRKLACTLYHLIHHFFINSTQDAPSVVPKNGINIHLITTPIFSIIKLHRLVLTNLVISLL